METPKGNENFKVEPHVCDTCFNEFEGEKFIPMILKCGHTFCQPCIEKLNSTSRQCPTCRAIFIDPTVNYKLLESPNFKIKGNYSISFAAQLEILRKELVAEGERSHANSLIVTDKLNRIDGLLKENHDNLNQRYTESIIRELRYALQSMQERRVPKIYATAFPKPNLYFSDIYQKIESGEVMMCVHQKSYGSELMYGKVSLWSDYEEFCGSPTLKLANSKLLFHCLTMTNLGDCEKFLLFDDLKVVSTFLKMKLFLKVKTKTNSSQLILIKPLGSPLTLQFIRLCTGETGSSYKECYFEEGEDKNFWSSSLMSVSLHKKGNIFVNGNVDYNIETKSILRESFYGPAIVVVGSHDGSFQIFESNYKSTYKHVIGEVVSPLNMKNILDYKNAKILDCGIAF